MAHHQGDVQAALLQRRGKVPVVHLRNGEHHVRMCFVPAGQEAAERLADRRHPNAEADFTHTA